jgi:hypothetical protein
MDRHRVGEAGRRPPLMRRVGTAVAYEGAHVLHAFFFFFFFFFIIIIDLFSCPSIEAPLCVTG